MVSQMSHPNAARHVFPAATTYDLGGYTASVQSAGIMALEDGELYGFDDVDAADYAHFQMIQTFKCWDKPAVNVIHRAIEAAYDNDNFLDADRRAEEVVHAADIAVANASMMGRI